MTTETSPPAQGDAQPNANANAGVQPPAGQVPPASGAGEAYRPEGLPEQFHGANDRETIDRLFKSVEGFRKAQSSQEAMPKDASGYEFTFAKDEVKAFAADLDATADPLMKAAKEAAFQAGIPPKAANAFFERILGDMLNMDVLDKPTSIEEAKIQMAPPEARNLPPAERDAAAQKRVGENVAYLNSFVQGGFDAEQAKVLAAELAAFPELNSLFEHLRGQAGGPRPALGGQPGAGVTKADVKARLADPRHQWGNPAYDPAFVAETERLGQALYDQQG